MMDTRSVEECEDYTPLARPTLLTNTQPPLLGDESDSDSESSLDSDEASSQKHKLPKKRKYLAKDFPSPYPVKKKFNIWSDISVNESMEESLSRGGIFSESNGHTNRGSESYNYQMKCKFREVQGEESPENEEMTVEESEEEICENPLESQPRSEIKGRPKKFANQQRPRKLKDLTATLEDVNEAVAADLAEKLFERNVQIIENAVNVLGKATCFELFKEVQKIELNGGRMTLKNNRRRTSGGIFLQLVKARTSYNEAREIFKAPPKPNDEKSQHKQQHWRKNLLAASKNLNEIPTTSFTPLRNDLPPLPTMVDLVLAAKDKEDQEWEADIPVLNRENAPSPGLINPPPSPEVT